MLGVTCVHYEIQRPISKCSAQMYRFTDYWIGDYLLGSSEAPLNRTTSDGEPVSCEYVHGSGQYIPFENVPHFLVQHMGALPRLIQHVRETVVCPTV